MVTIVWLVMISNHLLSIIITMVDCRRRCQTTIIRNQNMEFLRIRKPNTDHHHTTISPSMVPQFIIPFIAFHSIVITIICQRRHTMYRETIGSVWTNLNSILICTQLGKFCWNCWFSRKLSNLWLWSACCCFCPSSKATALLALLFMMKDDNWTQSVRICWVASFLLLFVTHLFRSDDLKSRLDETTKFAVTAMNAFKRKYPESCLGPMDLSCKFGKMFDAIDDKYSYER